jgi:hypothetical protein
VIACRVPLGQVSELRVLCRGRIRVSTTPEGTKGSGRTGAWMGIAFAVLFVAGFLVFPTPSSNKAKDTLKWQQWWNDSGHRTAAIIGAYLMVLGVLAFVWFAWNLRLRLRDREGLQDLGGLMFAFGALFAGIGFVAILVRAAVAGARQFGSTPVPAGDFARQFDQLGFGLLLLAGGLWRRGVCGPGIVPFSSERHTAGLVNDRRICGRRPSACGHALLPVCPVSAVGACRFDRALESAFCPRRGGAEHSWSAIDREQARADVYSELPEAIHMPAGAWFHKDGPTGRIACLTPGCGPVMQGWVHCPSGCGTSCRALPLAD